tara:strand:- start:1109 stop:1345 length:237 start_codon:yes stop_codon:yes gene_type:complete
MNMKIDTQGMSFGDGKDSGKSLEEQRNAIPPLQVNKINIISDSLKIELKQLINEVLDERNEKMHRDANDDSWLYRGTY